MLNQESFDVRHAVRSELDPQVGQPRSRRAILIVEDDVDSAEMLRETLAMDGHETLVAADGPTALVLARTYRPAIALIDVGLPGMDGYEVGRRLRSMHSLGGIFLVTLTAYAEASYRRRSIEAGFDAHVVKPFDFDALEELILGRQGAPIAFA